MGQSEAATAIRELLLRERRLLQTGEIDGLTALLDEKARCLTRAAEIRDPATLAHLRALADRNQALLTAAAAGLRSATMRLAQLRDGLGALSTYDEDGDRKGPPPAAPTLERRA